MASQLVLHLIVYYPLIVIDNAIGTGRPIASEPMYRLSVASLESPLTRRVPVKDR